MFEPAGLIAAAVLFFTLIALEVQFVGQDNAQPARMRLLGLTINRIIVTIIWVVFLLLFVPRLLDLLL